MDHRQLFIQSLQQTSEVVGVVVVVVVTVTPILCMRIDQSGGGRMKLGSVIPNFDHYVISWGLSHFSSRSPQCLGFWRS